MASSGDRQTLAADGQTTSVKTINPVRMSLTGTFGGGTAKLQVQDPNEAWVDVAGGSFTAVTDTLFDFPKMSVNDLRVDISGSTTPALVVWLQW